MPERVLVLNGEVAGAIRRHGEETYPHECCGALIGHGDHASAAIGLPNTTEEGPRRRFLVRPSDYRLAEGHAKELGGDLLGFYHSHPDHPARPSQYDPSLITPGNRVIDMPAHPSYPSGHSFQSHLVACALSAVGLDSEA